MAKQSDTTDSEQAKKKGPPDNSWTKSEEVTRLDGPLEDDIRQR